MKKSTVLFLLAAAGFLQFCSSSKKLTAETAKVTYAGQVQPIIQANCTPCHVPPQGKAKPLNTYEAVKTNIDEMIVRIKKNPGEKGFMPLRHPKLPDSTIAAFERWKETGLAE